MSKNTRKLICLILTLGLIFSLAACGSAGNSSESNSSSAPSEETGSQAAAADDKTTPEQTDEPAKETPADNTDGSASGLLKRLNWYP